MTRFIPAAPLRTAVLIGALSITATGTAVAQDGGVPTEEMRAAIARALALAPMMNGGRNPVTVTIEDGRYVLAGFVDGIASKNDAMAAIGSIEGLDASLIEDRIVRQ